MVGGRARVRACGVLSRHPQRDAEVQRLLKQREADVLLVEQLRKEVQKLTKEVQKLTTEREQEARQLRKARATAANSGGEAQPVTPRSGAPAAAAAGGGQAPAESPPHPLAAAQGPGSPRAGPGLAPPPPASSSPDAAIDRLQRRLDQSRDSEVRRLEKQLALADASLEHMKVTMVMMMAGGGGGDWPRHPKPQYPVVALAPGRGVV